MLKYGILGFGELGKVHFEGIGDIEEKTGAKIIAICDCRESAFNSQQGTNLGEGNANLEYEGINLYTDAEEMMDKEELDFIISALPTYIHEKYAVMAMEKGIHMFSEKPMAISYEQGENMIKASKKNNVKLMIGQCVRYFPEYVKLKEFIDNKTYGKLIEAEFSRVSAPPIWGFENWFMDESLSGGAVLDLHVHDTDFISYLFGKPEKVLSIGTNYVTKHDSVFTVYYYDNDALITAKGAWGYSNTYPFGASFRVRFEAATLELGKDGLMLYPKSGEVQKIEHSGANGYVEEVVDFINCIENDTESKINPPEASLQTIEIAFAEKKSIDIGEAVKL